MTPAVAERRIRAIALDSGTVIFSQHAGERMAERDIFDFDVLRILREGSIRGDPEATERGEWQCKMVRKLRGGREAGVVTIIFHGGKLFVKTVEWEDLR
ncbi:MAG: DUF4258 domain-containing protein [Alphaproteobacteria bacterium]